MGMEGSGWGWGCQHSLQFVVVLTLEPNDVTGGVWAPWSWRVVHPGTQGQGSGVDGTVHPDSVWVT